MTDEEQLKLADTLFAITNNIFQLAVSVRAPAWKNIRDKNFKKSLEVKPSSKEELTINSKEDLIKILSTLDVNGRKKLIETIIKARNPQGGTTK